MNRRIDSRLPTMNDEKLARLLAKEKRGELVNSRSITTLLITLAALSAFGAGFLSLLALKNSVAK